MSTTLRYAWGKKSNNATHIIRVSLKVTKYKKDDGGYGLRIVKSKYIGSKENDPNNTTSPVATVNVDTENGTRRAYVPISKRD